MARPELRGSGEFYYDVNERMPDDEKRCNVRASDDLGSYALPFPVYRKAGAWFNVNHDIKLEIPIVGWRYA
jgi:hypothetical protein